MRVYIVLESIEHDEYNPTTDDKRVIGVYHNKADAISLVNARYGNELEGRGLDESDGWTDHNGGYIRDPEDECELVWAIEPHEVY